MRTIRTLVLAVALAGTAGACSDEGGNRAADVATLDPDGGSAAAPEGGDGGAPVPGGGQGGRGISPEFQDALVEFAECMREHGVDMPDPQVDGDGRVGIVVGGPAVGGGPGSAPDIEELEAAQEACQPIMDAVADELPRPDPEQLREMQDRALEFAQCMREHGVDMPDPVFDENGRITQSLGGGRPVDAEALQEAQAACGRDGMPGIAVGGAGTSGSFTTGERIRGGDG